MVNKIGIASDRKCNLLDKNKKNYISIIYINVKFTCAICVRDWSGYPFVRHEQKIVAKSPTRPFWRGNAQKKLLLFLF